MATFTIEDSVIYYEDYGKGIPVLMLHGRGMDSTLMKGCMERVFTETVAPAPDSSLSALGTNAVPSGKSLSDSFRRIYIDLPGMGRSTHGESVKNSDDILRELIFFADSVLLPGERFIVAGQSYGAFIARGFAHAAVSGRMPFLAQRLAGLFLLCPLMVSGSQKGTAEQKCVLKKDDYLLEELSPDEKAVFTHCTVQQTRAVWNRFKDEIYPAMLHQNLHFLNDVLDTSFSYDIDETHEPFTEPVMVIAGKQDSEAGFVDQLKLLRQYPHSSYAVLDGGGHYAQIEQSDFFTSVARGWFSAFTR